MEPIRGAHSPSDKPGRRKKARADAAASPKRLRPRRAQDSRDQGGSRLPGSLHSVSSPSSGTATRHAPSIFQQRRLHGVRANHARPVDDRAVVPAKDVGPNTADPVSFSDAASPADHGQGATSPSSPLSGGVDSGLISPASPLTNPGNSRYPEQPGFGQVASFRSNPASGFDSTKSPPDRQKLTSSPLTLTLFVVGAASFVTLVALVIASLVMKESEFLSNACKTHACLAYSERLLASINESVNPCQSFTHFVCDGWRHKNERNVWEDQFISVLDKVSTVLNGIAVPESGQNQEQRAAIMYRSCVVLLDGERDELPAVKEALSEAGIVWPKPSKGADALHTLVFSSLKFGWDVLLDFDVETSVSAIKLTPGKFLYFVTKKQANEAYFEFLKERFRREGEDTVSYQDINALGEPALKYLSEARHATPGEHSAESFRNTTELGLTEPNWMAVLLKLNMRLNGTLSLTTTSPRYLDEVLRLWRQNGTDSFHTFISWCTVQVAALFANKDLIFNYYDNDYAMTLVYYRVFCVTRAMYFSRLSFFDQYNAEVLQGNALHLAKNLTLSLQTTFHRRLSNWTYFDEDISVISNRSFLEMLFRNFEHRAGDELPNMYQHQLLDFNDSFVRNWQQSVHVRKVEEFELMVQSIHELHYYTLSYDKRQIELMPYALSFPLFDAQLPLSVNYGGLGAEVVTALGRLFYFAYTTSNASNLESFIDCLRPRTSGKLHLLEYYVAFVIGFGALVDSYDAEYRTSDHGVFGLKKYTGMQLFFIALCYTDCLGSSESTDGETVCGIALQYLPEFSEAFHCAPGDPMNPIKHCKLF